jgi:heme-degrading monooxygenase HmoA
MEEHETLRRRKMHARVISFTVQPGKTDEAIKFFRDYLPKMKEQKGFKGLFELTNRNTGKWMHITLWNTEADITAAMNTSDYQEALAKMALFFAGPPTMMEQYEVTLKA